MTLAATGFRPCPAETAAPSIIQISTIRAKRETTRAGLCVQCCCRRVLHIKYHTLKKFDVKFCSSVWSQQIVEQMTTLKNLIPVNKSYTLLSVETSWVLIWIWHLSHPSHKLALSPNTVYAYRADTLPTAGIIKDFSSQTAKTFPACNSAARFMSNQLLPQKAKEEQSSNTWWWQHQGRTFLLCTWSCDTRAALDEPALPKPIPQQKAFSFKVASCGPPYHEMDTSKLPTLHLYSLNSAEIHTGTHRNRSGTSFFMVQYLHQHWYFGTFPLRKEAFHFMSPQEWWGSLGFYSCQRHTSLFWSSTASCREKGNKTGCEQDQINIYSKVCVAFV